MRGEGVLRDPSQAPPWSRKRTLNGCKMKRNFDNVVLIDVDGERFDNVIIIDVPESLQHKIGASSSSSKGKKFRFRSIISIDDDEDVESPDMGTYGACDMESDTSSGKSFPASDNVNKSVDLDDDECQVVQEKKSAFGVSKCQQVSGKDPFRCGYGLYESSSSDSDGSDCEVMEGSFGPLHKEWVKASLKRKSNAQKGKSGLGDQAGPSCFNNDATPNVDVEVGERTEQHSKSAFYSNSNNANNEKQNSSTFVPTGDRDSGTASLHPGMESPFGESGKNVDQKGLHTDRQSPQGHSSRSNQEESDKQYHPARACYVDKHQNFFREHFNFQGFNCNFHDYSSFGDEEASLCKCQQSGQTHDNNERVTPNDKHEEFSRATSSSSSLPGKSHHAGTGSTRKNKQISEEGLVSNSQPFYETGGECGVAPSNHTVQAVFEDSFGITAVFNEKAGPLNVEKLEPNVVSACDKQFTEAQSKQASPCVADIKGQAVGSMTNNQLGNGMDLIHAQSVSFTPALGKDIINEREKLKETDEYKRAMEEEWASRHLQLQIQAEEAKRLRKKKRAETMRLLDMERRQKLRLEEIRETQKKDQENMNLKEQLRAEVRKELYKLETTCIDMASLLRALGIHVGGSFHPLSQEVHAAYKRALLRFHPDRASKTDIRQQVEAEEKFKLISRMKEKLLLTI